MKKIIILIFTFLYSTLGFCKVNIEDVYNNSTLNIDYSSSMTFNEKQLVQEKEIAEWILSNPNRFENVNQIKIAFETKWYWGSWKKVVRALEFVKKENIQNRIAYFEDLRKRNEAECRKQQQRKELLTGLRIEAAKFIGIKIYENRHEIINFVKENWSSSTSSYSNDSYSNNSFAKDEGKSKDDCESNYNNVSITNKGDWSKDNSLAFNDYRQKIEFSDGISGYIYQGSETKKYFLSLNPSSIYYDSYESVIRALYIYKKCDKITKLGEN